MRWHSWADAVGSRLSNGHGTTLYDLDVSLTDALHSYRQRSRRCAYTQVRSTLRSSVLQERKPPVMTAPIGRARSKLGVDDTVCYIQASLRLCGGADKYHEKHKCRLIIMQPHRLQLPRALIFLPVSRQYPSRAKQGIRTSVAVIVGRPHIRRSRKCEKAERMQEMSQCENLLKT